MLDGNVTYVFIRTGQWQADGTISLIPSETQLYTAINATHTYGLQAFAWIIDDFYNVPIATSGERTIAVNSLITIANRDFGSGEKFDGIADDIELWHNYDNIITFWNEATIGLHTLGKEYFTATIGYWFTDGQISITQINSIRVDRLQPMLYLEDPNGGDWKLTEAVMKSLIIRILANSECLVGLIFTCDNVFGQSADSMTESMIVIDDAIDEVSTTYLAGFTVFAVDDSIPLMDSGQWNEWNAWTTKNVIHADPTPTPPPPTPTPTPTISPTPTPIPETINNQIFDFVGKLSFIAQIAFVGGIILIGIVFLSVMVKKYR